MPSPAQSPEEFAAFAAEVARLPTELQEETFVDALVAIYRAQLSGLTQLEIQLRAGLPTAKPLLASWLERITRNGKLNLPSQTTALRTFLTLAKRGLPENSLSDLLNGELNKLPADQLLLLERTALPFLEVWANYQRDFVPFLGRIENYVALQLIVAGILNQEDASAEDLAEFVGQHLAPLCDQTDASYDLSSGYFPQPVRIESWFKTFCRHRNKTVMGLDQENAYYQNSFENTIKWVPGYIWKYNGLTSQLPYRLIHLESVEFRHLATGGSLRKLPFGPPFTRRMAKDLLQYDFFYEPLPGRDDYLYLYASSLGCSAELAAAISGHMRNHETPAMLAHEMETWNPVIQKLAELEPLPYNQLDRLLGYLYHQLRDQPDFNLTGMSRMEVIEQMLDYYDRIEARRTERERRAAEREERYGNDENNPGTDRRAKVLRWPPHPDVKPYRSGKLPGGAVQALQIIELTDSRQLAAEGRAMGHCVGSYDHYCKAKHGGIWSLRALREDKWYSLVTIRVNFLTMSINEASARFNATPDREYFDLIRNWATSNQISLGVML